MNEQNGTVVDWPGREEENQRKRNLLAEYHRKNCCGTRVSENEWKVCRYDLAKRLAELDVDQTKSERVWVSARGTPPKIWRELRPRHAVPRNDDEGLWVAAYDGSELGVMLPELSYTILRNAIWESWNPKSEWRESNTESNSRAAMLIWLLDNGHVSVEDVNRRLAV